MEGCTKTNMYWDDLVDNVENFLATDGWKAIAQANYDAQTAVIDQQWSFYLGEWSNGVYFNAGMFYGRTYMALTTGTFWNTACMDC